MAIIIIIGAIDHFKTGKTAEFSPFIKTFIAGKTSVFLLDRNYPAYLHNV